MNTRNYSSHGFVTQRRRFSEADKIVTIFTSDYGKVVTLAKGVRRPTSKKRGGLEIFNHIKFSATKSHGMDIITEVEIENSYENIRKSLKKISVAYYLCEVINRTTQEGEPHTEVFDLLSNYFDKLTAAKSLKSLRLEFVTKVLIALGFWPKDKPMLNPDGVLENVIERKINSVRVGKKMLQQD